MADEAEDRTQAPSERRRARAREEGQVPLSRELVVASGLGAATLFMAIGMMPRAENLTVQLRNSLVDLDAPPDRAIQQAALALLGAVGPFLVAIAVAGAVAVLLQTGFLLNTNALLPDLGRLDPRRGLKKLFGIDNLIEAGKALAKLGLLGWAAWSALSPLFLVVQQALAWPPAMLAERIGRALVHLLLLVLAAQFGLAVLDAGWTRWRFSQRLRMSREELKQETKEADGDPKVKARLRQLRLARARRRMLAAVAKATVVVTNPTHYAVALAYERGGAAAPRVVAKGMDEVAARIRAAAERAHVPVVANPPLARALHAMPLDAEIPPQHFKAVAEIIAYVWRLRRLAPGMPGR
jgi:flagellar biosynthetic protein FlhB